MLVLRCRIHKYQCNSNVYDHKVMLMVEAISSSVRMTGMSMVTSSSASNNSDAVMGNTIIVESVVTRELSSPAHGTASLAWKQDMDKIYLQL